MADIEAERETWRSWVRGKNNYELLAFTIVFVILMSLVGVYYRMIWTPTIIIVGSYLVIDWYMRIVLKFENGVAYFVNLMPKNRMRPIEAYSMFIIFVVATAFVAQELATVVEAVNRPVPPYETAIVWTALVGVFLYLDLVSLYKESLVPHLPNL